MCMCISSHFTPIFPILGALLSSISISITIWCHLPSPERISFRLSFRAINMPMNIPTFLYMKIPISLILWRTFWYTEFLISSFCLSTLKMLIWCLLASLISEEKSSANHIVPLQVIVIFSCYYEIFSLSFALEVWLWGNLVWFSWYFYCLCFGELTEYAKMEKSRHLQSH